MSFQITKQGQLITSPEDYIDGSTGSNWQGNYTFSNGIFTCNSGTATMYHSELVLLPNDIFCIEFDLRCVAYGGNSGVFVGAQHAIGDGNITCYQAVFDFSSNTWGSWSGTGNPYYIHNYIDTAWGHVKTYVCGCDVDVNILPPPERTGGAVNYGITCNKAVGSNGIYPNQMCFWRLGANALSGNTQFQFANIKAYKLGNIEQSGSNFRIFKDSATCNELIEY